MKTGKDHNTREVVLRTIKAHSRATVDDLAEAAGVSPMTVRHHLNGLLADGLIQTERVRRKIGRPHHVYSLSSAGHELFPQKYYSLSNRLLAELKSHFPPEIVNTLFENVVTRILSERSGEFEHLSFEERLDYLTQLLADEGFMAHWEKVGDNYEIIEHSCPFFNIAQEHAEICTLDNTLIEAIMETPVSRHNCMLNGDSCCRFVIQTPHQVIPLKEIAS
jgi:predicted ArsR family transcriptional regulator